MNPRERKAFRPNIQMQVKMSSEIAKRAEFDLIRYAQCWEDADILLEALNIQEGDTCLSIASAGENSLSMLTQNPSKVIALDLSHAQLACLDLRVAAFKELSHSELLELIGSKESTRRLELYKRCRPLLNNEVKVFWDSKQSDIETGIGSAGKFENYFALFRKRVLPLIHGKKTVLSLLDNKSKDERHTFYEKTWNNWRWQGLFRIFFSRFVMGRMGRDPEFFKYVEGSVAKRILSRAKYALTELNPAKNPYLQWILTGTHTLALPHALREENFENIRDNLNKLEYYPLSVETYLKQNPVKIQRYNLSDIFEYMSEENTASLLATLVNQSEAGGRLAYWNMLVPRSRPESLKASLEPLKAMSEKLFQQDKAFFYSRFIVEEVL